MHSKLSKAPIIGITASLYTIDKGVLLGRDRAFIGHDYINAVLKSGGIPIVLPVVESEEAVLRQAALVDGIILSGGYDVDPELFNEEPHLLLEGVHRVRDLYEITLVKQASKKEIPTLGICRGLQLMNVAFGGTLYQDLIDYNQPLIQHRQTTAIHQGSHTVDIGENTLLAQIFNKKSIRTNSLHHQSIKVVANNFQINAKSRDGIVEGIEKKDHPFMLGLQWHPELMFEHDEETVHLFQTFIDAASKKKEVYE